jgi:hypothetical protein
MRPGPVTSGRVAAWVEACRTDRRSAARGGHCVHGGHCCHSTHGRAVGGHGTHGGWSRSVTSLRMGLGRRIDCRSAARGGRSVHGAMIASYVAARTYWRLGSAHAWRTHGTVAGSHRARRERCHAANVGTRTYSRRGPAWPRHSTKMSDGCEPRCRPSGASPQPAPGSCPGGSVR